MKILLELYLVSYVKEGFHTVRKELDVSQEDRDPDTIANEYLHFLFQDAVEINDNERYLLHSTSWRYEEERKIYLTYIAYSDSFKFKRMNPGLLRFSELKTASSVDPKKPRPEHIPPKAVISHGLQHLSYLISHDFDQVFKKAISKDARKLFEKIPHILAGRLS